MYAFVRGEVVDIGVVSDCSTVLVEFVFPPYPVASRYHEKGADTEVITGHYIFNP